MEVGQYYKYVDYTDDSFEEISIEGYVIYRDDKIAIVKIDNRYEEMFFYTLDYKELKGFYPVFVDFKAERMTEYLCLDVESEIPLYFKDPDSPDIHPAVFDDDHFFLGYDMESVAKAPADYDMENMLKECVRRELGCS